MRNIAQTVVAAVMLTSVNSTADEVEKKTLRLHCIYTHEYNNTGESHEIAGGFDLEITIFAGFHSRDGKKDELLIELSNGEAERGSDNNDRRDDHSKMTYRGKVSELEFSGAGQVRHDYIQKLEIDKHTGKFSMASYAGEGMLAKEMVKYKSSEGVCSELK